MSSEKFDEKSVQKIAHLARLNLTNTEAVELSQQLSKVIAHFDEISLLDTHGIEPLITPSEIEFSPREDIVNTDYTAEAMVANAPEKQGNLFKVPPVV